MRKWKHDYQLKMKLKKNKLLDDETGFTLIELLASISILSIVILLAGSIHIFGQRHFIDQSESAAQANDFSYALTVMTTDLRRLKSEEVAVIADGNEITVNGESIYNVENNQLKKGSIVLVEEVRGQAFSKDDKSIAINIESVVDSGLKKKYETKIYFRR